MNTKQVIEKKRLELSSPEFVYQYLEAHSSAGVLDDGNIPDETVESLFKRNNDLINLALAQFISHSAIINKIFSSTDDQALRCAALSNPKIFGSLEIPGINVDNISFTTLTDIVKKGSNAEVNALMVNRAIKGDRLAEAFKKEGWCKNLHEDRWFFVSAFALGNPNIHADFPDDFRYDDGWATYQHNNAIEAAWNLLLTAPLTDKWAAGLYSQFTKYKIASCYAIKMNNFLQKVFKRWVSESEETEEQFIWLRKIIASTVSYNASYNEEIRMFLVNHEDLPVRQGYYESFKPHNIEEIDKYYKKDRVHFIESAVNNENLYKNEEIRNYFSALVSEKDSHVSDIFYRVYDKLKKQDNSFLIKEEKDAVEHITVKMMKEFVSEIKAMIVAGTTKKKSWF